MNWHITFCLATVIAAAIGTAGCNRNSESNAAKNDQPKEKSAVEQVAEDFTGITTLREGKKLEVRVKKIQATRQQQLDGALGEDD